MPRKKKRPTLPGKLEVTDTIQINQEVYDMIEEYKRLTLDFFSKSTYLISYKAYRKYVKTKTKEKAREKVGAFQFITLIDRFYDGSRIGMQKLIRSLPKVDYTNSVIFKIHTESNMDIVPIILPAARLETADFANFTFFLLTIRKKGCHG